VQLAPLKDWVLQIGAHYSKGYHIPDLQACQINLIKYKQQNIKMATVVITPMPVSGGKETGNSGL
jgi:hypothetical protein